MIGLPGAACKVQSAGPLQFTCNARTMHTERMVSWLRVLELLLANPPPRSRACSRDERGRDKPMDKPWDNKRTAATYATVCDSFVHAGRRHDQARLTGVGS